MVDRKQILADLKGRIRLLEGHSPPLATGVRFNIPALDDALPESGLPLGCIHEVYDDGVTAAAGFVAAILTLLPKGPVIWISDEAELYLLGLSAFGIGPDDLLLVQAKNARDRLWVMEQALRWPGLKAVVAELSSFDLNATRRLQLAAESSGVTGFIIAQQEQGLTSGMTRWHVTPAPSCESETACWHIDLSRCRSGHTTSCTVHWHDGFHGDPGEAVLLQKAMQ